MWGNYHFPYQKDRAAGPWLRDALATRRGRPSSNYDLVAHRTTFVHRLASDPMPRSRATDLEQANGTNGVHFIAQALLT